MPRAMRSWKLLGFMALSATAALLWLLLPAPTQSQSGASTNYPSPIKGGNLYNR